MAVPITQYNPLALILEHCLWCIEVFLNVPITATMEWTSLSSALKRRLGVRVAGIEREEVQRALEILSEPIDHSEAEKVDAEKVTRHILQWTPEPSMKCHTNDRNTKRWHFKYRHQATGSINTNNHMSRWWVAAKLELPVYRVALAPVPLGPVPSILKGYRSTGPRGLLAVIKFDLEVISAILV